MRIPHAVQTSPTAFIMQHHLTKRAARSAKGHGQLRPQELMSSNMRHTTHTLIHDAGKVRAVRQCQDSDLLRQDP